jgi:hypothetical protein
LRKVEKPHAHNPVAKVKNAAGTENAATPVQDAIQEQLKLRGV